MDDFFPWVMNIVDINLGNYSVLLSDLLQLNCQICRSCQCILDRILHKQTCFKSLYKNVEFLLFGKYLFVCAEVLILAISHGYSLEFCLFLLAIGLIVSSISSKTRQQGSQNFLKEEVMVLQQTVWLKLQQLRNIMMQLQEQRNNTLQTIMPSDQLLVIQR